MLRGSRGNCKGLPAGTEPHLQAAAPVEGDQETWKRGIYATALERKGALAQFAFALDSALTGNTAAADKAWARAVLRTPHVCGRRMNPLPDNRNSRTLSACHRQHRLGYNNIC